MLLDSIQVGRVLSVSYYDKDGKTKIKNIKLDDSQMFNWVECSEQSKDKDPTYVSWNNKPVKKKPVAKLNNFRVAEILDDLPKADRDAIFEYNLPRMFFVDIENEIDPDLTPQQAAEQARKPITVIGIATPERQIIVLSFGKDLTQIEQKEVEHNLKEHTRTFGAEFSFAFKYFDKEKNMLEYFFEKFVAKFPMMSGWNFVEYDWKYIANRSKKIDADLSLASPIRKIIGKNRFPAHVGIVDYMECYQKWDTSVAKENLKLDQAGLDVLGVQKVHYAGTLDDLYRDDFKKYVYYNAIDCALVEMLHEKLGVSSIGNTLTYIAKCPTMRMFSPVALTESILARDYYQNKKVLPEINRRDKSQQGYEGAYVKQPKVGFHRFCICNDFASLYPNIIRELNLSPETLVVKLQEDDKDGKLAYLDKGYIVSESGCVFKKDPGVFSTLVGRVYMQRKSYKKTAVDAAIKARLLEDLLRANNYDEAELKRRYEQIMNS